MRVLVTGSSGWLGRRLVPRLREAGHEVVGLDPVPGATTALVGSVADRAFVAAAIARHGIEAVVHSGALHKPDIERRGRADFLAVNVQGTFNLLEEALAQGVRAFVFTSTTSVMISRAIRAGRAGGAAEAAWLTEEAPAEPRNIYGVTKLAAEHLCRLYHEQSGLPVVVLRTARFFPEADDMAHAIVQSDANTKANELLFRRLTVEDAAEAHLMALDRASQIGFDVFIVSAMPPFSRGDCAALIQDAPAVVARYFPDYPAAYARLGWTMFQSIDRVYDPSRAARRLGFVCRTGFREMLDALKASPGVSTGDP
ncbi:NAD-dependent epimerase/dehydratase family protein [Arenibaculum pallidiluteum]|uniref:NAD-dependent epimerase/dehydratase family protein n=1 Tax=Arenibaculum pallidiluteum TaxID=2812559 RepID=UPI001A961DD6|nr:NAD(P)-dependent oxidoreductase [Arenibaculum pallidiluteum]